MRIVLHHPVRLPPRDYGGVERVVLWLARGLREHGHEVYVVAAPGSRLPEGTGLIEWDGPDWKRKLPRGVDAVHFMAPSGAEWDTLDHPKILTVHGNGKAGERFPENTVFLSADHARRHGSQVFVHNGLDPAEYSFAPTSKKKNWSLFLSKTSWSVKNVRGAVRIAERAGIELKIAGGNRPLSLRARAFLDPRLHWVGPVNGALKAEALASARALLFPIVWEEPFGLVVIEALVSGTPVLAFGRGSLPELLTPEVGRIFADEDEWVAFLKEGRFRFEAEACRDRVLQKFHYMKMAESYVELYRRVAAGRSLDGSDSPGAPSSAQITRFTQGELP